jgi:hypothetical protein
MSRIVVAGYIVRYPLAGNVWAHLQYTVGLARLGHEVWFVEEAGWEDSCFDPMREVMTSDATYGVQMLASLMERFGLAGRWAYRDWAGEWHGIPGQVVDEVIASADLFLDVGGTCYFPQMHTARWRAYVDMDPVFTQLQAFGNDTRLGEYDVLFTYGTNIGHDTCPVPTLGFQWIPLLPPVVLDVWSQAAPPPFAPIQPIRNTQYAIRNPDKGARWTTIAHWSAYGEVEHDGETYGQKDREFMRFIELPRRAPYSIELAVSLDDVPVQLFKENGWHLQPSLPVSRDPWVYRDYIWASRGELSVAKHAYVKTQCGWFSDRTATYLASGRPAVVQDTGISHLLPTGSGLMVFRDMQEAVSALDAVESGYEAHSRAARELAGDCFDSDKVLKGLLEACGL